MVRRPRVLFRTMPSNTTTAPSSPCLTVSTSLAVSIGCRTNSTWECCLHLPTPVATSQPHPLRKLNGPCAHIPGSRPQQSRSTSHSDPAPARDNGREEFPRCPRRQCDEFLLALKDVPENAKIKDAYLHDEQNTLRLDAGCVVSLLLFGIVNGTTSSLRLHSLRNSRN